MAKNLWKSNRGARNEAQRDENEPFPSAQPDYVSVGEILRKQREERGEDLRYVAQILRIRYPYLKAIEDGHPDELPGPTYAVGFVRTYADHLGLSSEELVQQFKEEAANLQARADLHFPAPLPEGKIPSGAVLVIAVVLAAVVYSAWIYLSSREQQVAEIVPQLPNRISEIIKGNSEAAKAPAKPAEKPKMTLETDTPSNETPLTGESTEMAAQGTADTTQQQPAAPAMEESAAISVDETASNEVDESSMASQIESDVAAVAPAERSGDAIPPPPTPNAGASESETTSGASVSEQSGGGQESPAESGLSEAERASPKVYGEENKDARIVIHASTDSWVEVRDSSTDELLLTRVLFKGDSYHVPDRSGLTLLTGNAGGLRIVVDGADVPPIGPLGAVRRNVLLEPSPLLSGNAARQTDSGQTPTQSQTSEGGVQTQ